MFLRARAKAARMEERYTEAALLYEELARLRPDDGRLRIQCGHMRKEAGDLDRAEAHYRAAEQMLPDDAELALQLGHFHKVKGATTDAAHFYGRALAIRPGWDAPASEMRELAAKGWTRAAPAAAPPIDHPSQGVELAGAPDLAVLAPALTPRDPGQMLHEHGESIEIRRLGRKEPSFWGITTTLRGVEAIRGFCVSKTPVVAMRVLLNGVAIHQAPLKGGYTLKHEIHQERIRKYVFNAWLDFGGYTAGRYGLELCFTNADGHRWSFQDTVVIAEPLANDDYPTSDGIVPIADPDPAALEHRIRTAPSLVHPARRDLFPEGVRTVLVMRTDQLGDMVASVPALLRLRELLPDARIVGLLTAANADLARTLGLFDEIITIDFPDDPWERRRIMPLPAQEALRRRLRGYAFDIAIDLADSNVSRDLLQLAGAKFSHGSGGGHWPWMTSEVGFNTHDRWNGMNIVPHSAKVLAIVEALGTVLRSRAPVIRRTDLPRTLLAPFGLDGSQRFAVLHAGARIRFSRWPHYPALATMLLDRTDLHIVLISDDADVADTLPPALHASARFHFVGERLPFDQFDALISHATVVVGNDSGPKHLASLRGTRVVTLFTARINWAEWGQENIGSIIARRVPCQGCAIFHDAEECGQEFTCIRDIRVTEVFDEVMRQIDADPLVADWG